MTVLWSEVIPATENSYGSANSVEKELLNHNSTFVIDLS